MKNQTSLSTSRETLEAIQKVINNTKDGDRFAQTLRKKKISHLSFSQIAAVEFCPQRYYLDYVKEIPLVPLPNYFVKGKLIHQFIASSYMKIAKDKKINPKIYFKTIARHYDDHHRTHLENAIQVHLDNLWQGYQVIGIEDPFVIEISENIPPFVGVIDLLLQKEDQVIIVDHKTGGDFYSPDELQMAIYLHYAEKKFPNQKIKIYYDQYRWVNNLGRIRKPPFQRFEVSLPLPYWEPALERIHRGYKAIKKIREENKATRDGECFRCPFNSACRIGE